MSLPAGVAVALAPTAHPALATSLDSMGCRIRPVPVVGGRAWWGDLAPDEWVAFSQPNRLGLVERPPRAVPALVETDVRFTSLLDGGACSRVLIDGGWVVREWSARPSPLVVDLAERTEFLRRAIDALPGVTVVGEAPWLGAVAFLGGRPGFAVRPPIAGAPGLGVVRVGEGGGRRELLRLAEAVIGRESVLTGSDDTPHRRLPELKLCIP